MIESAERTGTLAQYTAGVVQNRGKYRTVIVIALFCSQKGTPLGLSGWDGSSLVIVVGDAIIIFVGAVAAVWLSRLLFLRPIY